MGIASSSLVKTASFRAVLVGRARERQITSMVAGGPSDLTKLRVFWREQLSDIVGRPVADRLEALVVNWSVDLGDARLRYVQRLIQVHHLLRQRLIQELLCGLGPSGEGHHIELVRNHTKSFHMLAPPVGRRLRLWSRPSGINHRAVSKLLVEMVLQHGGVVEVVHAHVQEVDGLVQGVPGFNVFAAG